MGVPGFLVIPDPVPDRFVLHAYSVDDHAVKELRYTYYEGPISHDEVTTLHGAERHGTGGVEWRQDWRCESRAVLGRWAPLEGEAQFSCGGRSDTDSMRRWFRTGQCGRLFERLIDAARCLVEDERKRVANAEKNLATAKEWLDLAKQQQRKLETSHLTNGDRDP